MTEQQWQAFLKAHGGLQTQSLAPDGSATTVYLGDGSKLDVYTEGEPGSQTITIQQNPQNVLKPLKTDKATEPHWVEAGGHLLGFDPSGNQVVDRPLPKDDKGQTPHTVTVAGKGTLQLNPTTGQWDLIPGSEPAPKEPDKPTTQITEVGGNRVQVITNPDGTVTQTILGPATRAGENASDLSAQGARQQSALSQQTSQQAIAAYNAKVAADQKAWQDKVDQGYEIKPADLEAMRAQNAQTLASLEAQLRDASAQATFEREQPNKVVEQQRLAGAQAETGRHDLATEDQSRLQTAAGTLGEQAKGARDTIDAGVKLGVAPPSSLVRMAFDPYQTVMAMLARNGVQPGQAPPQAPVSTSAPAPTAVMAAPAPNWGTEAHPDMNPQAPAPAMAAPRPLLNTGTAGSPAEAPLPTQTPATRDQWWQEGAA